MELIDILIEEKRNNEKFFKHPSKYAQKIKTTAAKIFGEARVKVYIFGSAATGNFAPSSDIDVLVIAPEVETEKRGEVLAELKKSVGFTFPFEIHLLTEKIFENWYKHFVGKLVRV